MAAAVMAALHGPLWALQTAAWTDPEFKLALPCASDYPPLLGVANRNGKQHEH